MNLINRSPLRFAETMRLLIPALAAVCAAACGGGGDGGAAAAPAPSNPPASSGGSGWIPGEFRPSASFAGQCRSPRPGTTDVQGSIVSENNWLRSWSHELYLWYDEIRDLDPALYTTPSYFDLLKTDAFVDGQPKDRFHHMVPTDEWLALSQSGEAIGYGVQWIVVEGLPPRRVVAAYVHPGSPADAAGIARGAEVLEVDGVDIVWAASAAEIAVLNAGLSPSGEGEVHDFVIRDGGAGPPPREVELESAIVHMVPVQDVQVVETQHGRVGYMHFTDHLAVSEKLLVEAVTELSDESVDHLVLDIRYNGGGYLAIASQLAYMIAGPAHTAGRSFESLRFNDKHPTTNPVTGEPLAPFPFLDQTVNLSLPPGAPLPTLNLDRVYVLTGTNTCSASESLINALRGVDVEVIQIGGTTCGKPYGFYPTDNCGTTYFTIQFQVLNEKGFGDYPNGFSPQNSIGSVGVPVPGCAVADDLSSQLGDPDEARFAVALRHMRGEGCPVPSAASTTSFSKPAGQAPILDGIAPKPPWLENRILVEF